MNRRHLLSAAAPAALALSGVAAGASAPCNSDVELIALCARYVAHTREYCAVGQHTENLPLSHPEYIRCEGIGCAMVPAMHAMEDQITDMPARTVAGLLAKAEAARFSLSGDADRDPEPMDPENALVWSLIEEMLTVLGRAA